MSVFADRLIEARAATIRRLYLLDAERMADHSIDWESRATRILQDHERQVVAIASGVVVDLALGGPS